MKREHIYAVDAGMCCYLFIYTHHLKCLWIYDSILAPMLFLHSLARQCRSTRKTQQREEAWWHSAFGSTCMLVDLILEYFPKNLMEAVLHPKKIPFAGFFISFPSNSTYTTKEIIVGNTPNLERKNKLSASPLRAIFFLSFPSFQYWKDSKCSL